MKTLILQIQKDEEIDQLRELLKNFDGANLFVEHALKPETFEVPEKKAVSPKTAAVA